MYIVLSTDDNFVQHCSVAISSIIKHNDCVEFFILTEGVTSKNEGILKSLVSGTNNKLSFLRVDSSITSRLPMPQGENLSHISVATYYRLFISSLLPNNIDKIIYLDCDIVVRGSLSELWNTDIHNMALAAVYQDDVKWVAAETYSRLGIPTEYGYFNAGVLLINLEYWRDNRIENKLLSYVSSKYQNIKFHDQDTLNGVLYDKTIMLDCKWNAMSNFLNGGINDVQSWRCQKYKKQLLDEGIINNPLIVHYVSRPKPWNYSCNVPFVDEYFYYLQFTPFNGWKPKFSLSSIMEYRVRPFYKKKKHQLKICLSKLIRIK